MTDQPTSIPEGHVVVSQQTLHRVYDSAQAFLAYFNPLKLPSAKEDQWYALYDQLDDLKFSLIKKGVYL